MPHARVNRWQTSGSGSSVSVTLSGGGISAGNSVIVIATFENGASGPWGIESLSAGIGTAKDCGVVTGNYDVGFLNVWLVESALAFAGPLVVTFGGVNGTAAVEVREYSSSSTLKLDAATDLHLASALTGFAGPNVERSGTADVLIGIAATNTTVTAVAAPYVDDVALKTTWRVAERLNTTSGDGPTWTASGTPSSRCLATVALSENPTTPVQYAIADFSGGTDGAAPTAATLQASMFGATALGPVADVTPAKWDVTNNASGLVYSRSASYHLASGTPRLAIGGHVYGLDPAALGLRYASSGGIKYVQFFLPVKSDFPGQVVPLTVFAGCWFRTSLIPTDTLNIDFFTIFGAGGGGGSVFTNAILGHNGGNTSLIVSLEDSVDTPTLISSNTWYWCALSYVAGGTGRLRIYTEALDLVGSELTVTCASLRASNVTLGNSNDGAPTTGRTIDFDGMQVLYAGEGTWPFLPATQVQAVRRETIGNRLPGMGNRRSNPQVASPGGFF